jgi:hypothetical protein
MYRSYWHARFHKKADPLTSTNYFTAVPNPGAGIGHQLANWIAGYWFAKQFGLRFAHSPFSSPKWEYFLGFGEGVPTCDELVNRHGYKRVLLPLFNEKSREEVELVKKIIASYQDAPVVFCAEQDQFYADQFGIQEDLQQKFYSGKARREDKLIYAEDSFNIAIHVRRGDIANAPKNSIHTVGLRWQGNDYFEQVLTEVVGTVRTTKPIFIYLFSQGNRENFVDFEKFNNIRFCLDMDVHDSFLHMVYADVLITSKSSFSYKPALLNKGIKVCPRDFWHGYPSTHDWVLADENGKLIGQINQM